MNSYIKQIATKAEIKQVITKAAVNKLFSELEGIAKTGKRLPNEQQNKLLEIVDSISNRNKIADKAEKGNQLETLGIEMVNTWLEKVSGKDSPQYITDHIKLGLKLAARGITFKLGEPKENNTREFVNAGRQLEKFDLFAVEVLKKLRKSGHSRGVNEVLDTLLTEDERLKERGLIS